MVAIVRTFAFSGMEATEVEVQVQLSPGLPSFTVVGLPDKAVGESRERVRAAIHSLGLSLPAKRITVNLAPADLLKEGSHFDLPIAIGLLLCMNVLPAGEMDAYYAMGELSLSGAISPVAGILPAAIAAHANGRGIVCPGACGGEAAWAGDIGVLAPHSLLALINHFKGLQVLSPPHCDVELRPFTGPDLRDVRGQAMARRALEVAAAGGHNLLMCGPPGVGKSLLAACLPGVLPPLEAAERLELSMIQSIAGQLQSGELRPERPFRSPHHSSSIAAMVGGGRRAVPGEISLSHHGVLFLDELPEFPRTVLEALRQPLESGVISVARANAHVTYPARFQLIAAMNPCRCGYLTDPMRSCGKAPRCAADYQSRLSGPLLDRIDLRVDVPAMDTLDMVRAPHGEPSADVALRVARARAQQRARAASLGLGAVLNSGLSGDALERSVELDDKARALLEKATRHFGLSMRGFTRVLRVARTVADLEASPNVNHMHLSEALSYREPVTRAQQHVA